MARALAVSLCILALFAVSTTIASPSPDGQGKIIPVQVTQVTTNSVTLSWETQGDVESRVFYGPTTHYDLKMEGPHGTQTKQHELKLEGLVPGTVYHFRLSDPSQPPQEANPDTARSSCGTNPRQSTHLFLFFSFC